MRTAVMSSIVRDLHKGIQVLRRGMMHIVFVAISSVHTQPRNTQLIHIQLRDSLWIASI